MSGGFVSRGFRGRRRQPEQAGRFPPGQYLTADFPVLSAGPTPHVPLEKWDFSIVGKVDQPKRWTWEEFRALPSEIITTDIHCVTRWSKLDTVWEGVAVDTLLEVDEFLAAVDASRQGRVRPQPGDTVRGSDRGEIGRSRK